MINVRLYLFKVCGRLNFTNGLHEGVSHHDTDVGTRVALCFLAERDEIGFREAVGGGAEVELDHERACVLLRKRDVDALFEPGQY